MEPKARIRELEGKVAELAALVSRYSAEDAARALERHGTEHHLADDVLRTVDQVLLGEKDEAIESHVGAVWVSRLAAVVIMMALAVAARTTFAYQEIEEIGKALIGYGIAGVFIGYGLFFERKRDLFAQAVLGCGLAVLYFTTYAIFFVPEMQLLNAPLWGVPVAVACLAGVLIMAHVRSSETVAGVALFLAYYTVYASCAQAPSLASQYHAAATCAVLAIIALIYQESHRWLMFSWAVMAATYLTYGYYFQAQPAAIPISEDTYFWLANGFLTACFLLFGLASIAGRRRGGYYRPMAAPLAIVNVTAYYVFAWQSMQAHFATHAWLFQAVLALVLFLFALLAETRGQRSNLLFQVYIFAGVVVTSLALNAALPLEHFLIAMALECLVLTLFHQRSGVIGFKVIELGLMLATAATALAAAGLVSPVHLGAWQMPASRFCAMGIALLFALNAWLYEKFTTARPPERRTRSGHWFLAESRLDWTPSSMAMAHAACGAFVLLTLTILELSNTPELPFVLGAQAFVIWMIGLILLTPQICVGAVLLLVAAHVCYHVFLYLPLDGFSTQQNFIFYTIALGVLTYLGGHGWERYLLRFKKEESDLEHHLIVAVPFLIGTALLANLFTRELNPLHVPAAQGALGVGLVLIGSFNRYTGVKASGILAMMFAIYSFYTGLNHPLTPLDKEPLFLLYFALFLTTCMGAERLFAFRKSHGAAATRIEDALRTLLVWMAMVLGLLGLYRWASAANLVFYLLAYAVIVLMLGVVFRESRYRWGALLLFGVVTYRAFTQFQDLPPIYQILVFGAPGVVLIIVSWAYSRRIAQFRKAARDKAATRSNG
jgi:hypothetical protein